jgi:anaerobic selenocysteine-containing dehydrogenase
MAFKLLFAVLAAVLVALATLATPAAAAEADSLTATSNMLKWGGYYSPCFYCGHGYGYYGKKPKFKKGKGGYFW